MRGIERDRHAQVGVDGAIGNADKERLICLIEANLIKAARLLPAAQPTHALGAGGGREGGVGLEAVKQAGQNGPALTAA